jgi:hypothetical protein
MKAEKKDMVSFSVKGQVVIPRWQRWPPQTRPVVKIDFCQSAVDKKEQTYESKTQTA